MRVTIDRCRRKQQTWTDLPWGASSLWRVKTFKAWQLYSHSHSWVDSCCSSYHLYLVWHLSDTVLADNLSLICSFLPSHAGGICFRRPYSHCSPSVWVSEGTLPVSRLPGTPQYPVIHRRKDIRGRTRTHTPKTLSDHRTSQRHRWEAHGAAR